MIIGPVEERDLHSGDALPTLDLPALGITPEHYEAIDRAVSALEKQGLAIIVKKG
jgi:sulfate adenylyltransferase subunit 1